MYVYICVCVYIYIYTHTYMSFPGGASGKESTCKAGDTADVDWIPGWGRAPGGGHGNPLQYSCLENPTHKGAWRATAHGATRLRHNLTGEHTCVLAESLQSWPTLCDPTRHSPPGSSVHAILQQEYWSGWLCPPPGDLPHPGTEPTSLTSPALAGGFFSPLSPPGKLPLHI